MTRESAPRHVGAHLAFGYNCRGRSSKMLLGARVLCFDLAGRKPSNRPRTEWLVLRGDAIGFVSDGIPLVVTAVCGGPSGSGPDIVKI